MMVSGASQKLRALQAQRSHAQRLRASTGTDSLIHLPCTAVGWYLADRATPGFLERHGPALRVDLPAAASSPVPTPSVGWMPVDPAEAYEGIDERISALTLVLEGLGGDRPYLSWPVDRRLLEQVCCDVLQGASIERRMRLADLLDSEGPGIAPEVTQALGENLVVAVGSGALDTTSIEERLVWLRVASAVLRASPSSPTRRGETPFLGEFLRLWLLGSSQGLDESLALLGLTIDGLRTSTLELPRDSELLASVCFASGSSLFQSKQP